MLVVYFTEQPMSSYPEAAGLEAGYTSLLFSNKHFDPVEGSRLYNDRLEEYKHAEASGFDAIMTNEHHNSPFCMQPQITVWSSILAAVTDRVKILQLGNPLPVYDNPLQFAETIAMIDMISKGRLIAGIVRGAGQEMLCMNSNPAYNRERFDEAHNLLVKCMTEEGPFHWEGEHYQFRVVNPWARVLQKPHPRIFVPGVLSPSTIVWAAQHRYPYVALNTPLHLTGRLWDIYDVAARRVGYTAGPENRGYLLRVHCQDDEAKAIRNAREFMWMQGEFTGIGHPNWMSPAGYSSADQQLAAARAANRIGPRREAQPFEAQRESLELIAGTPGQVIDELRILLERTRPGILVLWGNDGKISHEDSMRCIELLGREVVPAVKEIGKELGLHDPFEIDAPVSLAETPASQIDPQPHYELPSATAAAPT